MKKYTLLLFVLIVSLQAGLARTKFTEPFMEEIISNARKKTLSETDRFKALDALVNLAHNLYSPDTTIKLLNELLMLNNKIHAADPKPYLLMIEGQEYLKRNKPDSALLLFREMIDEFDKTGRIFPFNSYLTSIRILFNQLGRQDDKLNYYRAKLFKYLVTGPSENIGACYHGIAGYFNVKGEYNQALTYYFKARDFYQPFSQVGYGEELSVIGSVYNNWGNGDRATHYLRIADSIAQENHDSLRSQFCRMTRAIVLKDQGRYDEALKYIDSAFMLGIKSYKIENCAVLYATAVEIYLQLDNMEEACRHLQKLKILTDSLDMPVEGVQGKVEVDYLFYWYYQQGNNLLMAEKHLLKAYKEACSVQSATLMLKYQNELFDFYLASRTPLKAMVYAKQFFGLHDSLAENQNENNVAQYEIDFFDEQKKSAIRDLQQKKERQHRNYLIGGAFLFLIIIGIILRLWYIQKTRKQLEEKNRQIAAEKDYAEQMRMRAEQSEQFKQQFLANMSHEIRTPMNAVMGMTNLLIDKNPRSDQQPYLDGIKKSSGILLHILNDILDLAKIEAGKIELETIDFSLREMIDQVIQTMRYKAEEKGLSLYES
ncbi:MAG: histidine kinase dimerization/phospho-acceptor domain-containing protein, partial [bacterium]